MPALDQECYFCGGSFTPQGIGPHQQYCEDNPNRGVDLATQRSLDLLDGGATEPNKSNPDPTQDATEGSALPTRSTLAKAKTVTDSSSADQSERECPSCGRTDVLPASEAKRAYQQAVDRPDPRAVLAYGAADWACQHPPCAAVWQTGERAVTMKEVLAA